MIKYHSYSPPLAALHGKKPSWTDRFIGLRSELSHTELQFSERYGNVSFSATLADGCKCARFKMIGYSHPERWLTAVLEVTDEQEDAIFEKCCEMAAMRPEVAKAFCLDPEKGWWDGDCCTLYPHTKGLYYGPKALKYDTPQVVFGFISKLRIKKGDKRKVFCTESCFIALMEVWPELLRFKGELKSFDGEVCHPTKKLNPDELTPSMGDMIIRNAARRMR